MKKKNKVINNVPLILLNSNMKNLCIGQTKRSR